METSLQTLDKSDSADQAATLTQHPKYYSLEEFVVLKVENVLYRIFKSVLTAQSEFFEDMFSPEFSMAIKNNKEGSSNTSPIVFEQVLQVDFDRLLSLIITHSVDASVTKNWKSEDWLPILDLADRWRMLQVKQLALDSLRSLLPQPIVKINLGLKFEDKALIKSGLVDICSRHLLITESEATEIGLEATLKCVVIREKLWAKTCESRQYSYYSGRYAEVARDHATKYVEEAFSSGNLKVT